MKTPKPLAYAIATSFFAFASIGAVSASSGSAGSFADLLSLSGPSATFTGGPGGTLYVPSPPGTAGIPVNFFLDATHQTNAIFTLSPVVGTSTAVPVFGTFQETTTGGTFSIANGSTTYLSGTYTSGILGVANGGTTVSFKSGGANSVVYTGGTFLAPAGLSAGDIGSFNFSFSGANTGAGTGVSVGAYINSFVSRGASGTFSAEVASVPEPESLAPLIIGGMLLFGFGLRRRNVPAEIAA
ncbi:MAG: PEP-CTERM sorting domain-containing protein [Capsulimonas sp.]|uniref:PEP-CTERM sorting domain-containing protein n=1 Tax=Capsulimonas sp. TaxID=2494211 RepID=UPI003263052E